MNDPIQALNRFYEACDQETPPDSRVLAARWSPFAALRWMLALAPLSVGFAVAAAIIGLADSTLPDAPPGASVGGMEWRMRSAGVSGVDLNDAKPARSGRRVGDRWSV